MPGEFFFMALGGLGVSLAGFVGIITALDRREDSNSEVSRWRVRNIVRAGFTLTIIGFGTVAVYSVTGEDVDLTIRLISVFTIVANGLRARTELKPGPAWPDRAQWRFGLFMELALMVGYAAAVIVPSVGLLQLLLIFQLGFPLSIFFFTIRDISAGHSQT